MQSILVVDDDKHILKLLRRTLEKEGYRVISAENGRECLAMYHHECPDLLITDIVMPQKEGIETILSLKKEFPNLKAIAISGGGRISAEQHLSILCSLRGIKTMKKPLDLPELVNAVKELIGEEEKTVST